MPIVKPKKVHNGVYKLLVYIENAYKTKNGVLITGVNIPTNAAEAYDAFRDTYTYYSKSNDFDNQKINYARNEKGNLIEHSKVSLYHYVQSFDPKDNDKLTPEEANAIGIEWAKKTFGKDFQYIVSTHVDKNHIHNHIALCPYSLSGKKWNDNMKTLNFCRKMSDQIAKEHGLSIIENPQSKNNGKRKEWEARQNGTSWKKDLCDKLDILILKDNINTLEDIQRELFFSPSLASSRMICWSGITSLKETCRTACGQFREALACFSFFTASSSARSSSSPKTSLVR